MEFNFPANLKSATSPSGEVVNLVQKNEDGTVTVLVLSCKYACNNEPDDKLVLFRACFPKVSKEGDLVSAKVELAMKLVGEHAVPWGTANASWFSELGGQVDGESLVQLMADNDAATFKRWAKSGNGNLNLGCEAAQVTFKGVTNPEGKFYWTIVEFVPFRISGEGPPLRVGATYVAWASDKVSEKTQAVLKLLGLNAAPAPTPPPAPSGAKELVGSLLPATVDLENI